MLCITFARRGEIRIIPQNQIPHLGLRRRTAVGLGRSGGLVVVRVKLMGGNCQAIPQASGRKTQSEYEKGEISNKKWI